MIPSLRLMIVALSASLLAIVCAMTLFIGVFAAFSVAHQPLSALAAAKPPLQIAFADQISAPVADGRPAPFGVRFQLHAPQVPNGPVIVAVPAAPDRALLPEPPVAVESVTNPAANAQPDAPPDAQSNVHSIAGPPRDDAPPSSQEAPPPAATLQVATSADAKASEKSGEQGSEKSSEAKQDSIAGDDTSGATKPPAEPAAAERPVAASTPHHLAPPIRIASREADNPASVATAPAPTLARKGIKRRKLAVHLHQSHHFRRPRVHQSASVKTRGFVQPNAFSQPAASNYAPGAEGQPNGFVQPGFGFGPAAIRPRLVRWRRAGSFGGASSH
jgi:hypothetical protein